MPEFVHKSRSVLRGSKWGGAGPRPTRLRQGAGVAIEFALADEERAWAGFAVFRCLFQWTEVDPVTLWWVVRSACWLSSPESRGTYRTALDLIATLRPAHRTMGD